MRKNWYRYSLTRKAARRTAYIRFIQEPSGRTETILVNFDAFHTPPIPQLIEKARRSLMEKHNWEKGWHYAAPIVWEPVQL